MSNEYIEREEAKRALRIWITECVIDGDSESADRFRDCIDLLDSLDAADVAPVRRGHVVWVERPAVFAQYERHHSEDGITMYVRTCAEVKDKVPYCSECEKRLDDRFMKFCSNCGADIKEEA
jgi:hypothetical protein|nr:MAG TPA: PROTEIN/RNA Complex, archaeal, ribosomal, 50S, protein.0A [Caudoviricetes sp.]